MKWLLLFLSCLPCFGQFDVGSGTVGLSVRTLGSSAATGNDDNESTASYTPRANSMLVAIVVNTKASAPDQPVVSGNSLVWNEIFDTNFLTTHRLTIWQAKCGSGMTPGAFTASTAPTAQTGWCVGVIEITGGIFTGTGGTNGIRQRVNANTSTATATATFGALRAGAVSITLVSFDDNGTASPEAGWTELIDVNFNTPATQICVAYRLKNTDTTGVIVSDVTPTTGCIVGLEFGQEGNFP